MAACACELTRNREASGTFAAACAEAGPIDQAVSPAQRAHDVAVAHGDTNAAVRDLELERIYRDRKPFYDHDPSPHLRGARPTLPRNSPMVRILPGQFNRRIRVRSSRRAVFSRRSHKYGTGHIMAYECYKETLHFRSSSLWRDANSKGSRSGNLPKHTQHPQHRQFQ